MLRGIDDEYDVAGSQDFRDMRKIDKLLELLIRVESVYVRSLIATAVRFSASRVFSFGNSYTAVRKS